MRNVWLVSILNQELPRQTSPGGSSWVVDKTTVSELTSPHVQFLLHKAHYFDNSIYEGRNYTSKGSLATVVALLLI